MHDMMGVGLVAQEGMGNSWARGLQLGMEGSGEFERMELGLLVPKVEKPGTNSQLKDKPQVGQARFGEGRQRKSV